MLSEILGSRLFGVAMPLAMALVGLWLTVKCLAGLAETVRMRRRAVRVPGVVRSLRPRQQTGDANDETDMPQYAAVLEFQTADGRVIQTESDVASNVGVPQPGQQVPVAYDRDDPSNAHIDTFGGSGYLVYLIALPVSVVGAIGGTLWFIAELS